MRPPKRGRVPKRFRGPRNRSQTITEWIAERFPEEVKWLGSSVKPFAPYKEVEGPVTLG